MNEVYGRDLIGKDLGQFHGDFTPLVKGGPTPKAIESIFLGKKSYADVLVDSDGNTGLHYRMKRAPPKVMEHHAQVNYGGSVMEMYRHLAKHNPIELNGPSCWPTSACAYTLAGVAAADAAGSTLLAAHARALV